MYANDLDSSGKWAVFYPKHPGKLAWVLAIKLIEPLDQRLRLHHITERAHGLVGL
jgi:hypothetical protein